MKPIIGKMLMKSGKRFRIVQLSDLHLFDDPSKRLLNLNTHESFAAVLRNAFTIEDIDLLILSGDLSHDGSKACYRRLSEIMSLSPCPVMYCCGNHDDRENLEKHFYGYNILKENYFMTPHWQLILLNSQVPGKVHGLLDTAELKEMERRLKRYPDHQTLIFFHHQPTILGAAWLDNLGLQNSKKFFEKIKHYQNVKGVVFGHGHQAFEGIEESVKLLGTPATSFQFKPLVKEFALDKIPPGYRVIDLSDDGKIHSKVHRVPSSTGYLEMDYNSWGYK